MHISELEPLRNNPQIRFKTEELDGQKLTIVHYMIANSELWNNPMALEARGNVYNESGECICATFKKFFNVGERPETQLNLIKDQITSCQEKRDGSLVTPVLSALGRIVFKTKKSFVSDVAVLANTTAPLEVIQLSRYFIERGYTPLFEFTHPDARIVINYGAVPQFTLLAVRSFKTGTELPYSVIKQTLINLNALYPQLLNKVPLIPCYPYSWEDITTQLSTAKNIEGFVLILNNGTRVKIKTAEYLRLHRINTEIKERDIAESVVDETLDDILGVVAQLGLDRTPITKIEQQVISELNQLQQEVTKLTTAVSTCSLKEAAITLQGNPLFHLVMGKLRNKEPNFVDYWKRNYLKNYSLRCVYNSAF